MSCCARRSSRMSLETLDTINAMNNLIHCDAISFNNRSFDHLLLARLVVF